MKLHRLVVYKGRDMLPRIPPRHINGWSERWFVLFRVGQDRKVVERQLFRAYPTVGGITIAGFTHYAPLPNHL